MSPRSKDKIVQLDAQFDNKQLELNQLKYINSEIVQNEMPLPGILIHDLVKILAEIYLLRKQLEDSKNVVSNYYDIETEVSASHQEVVAETGQSAMTSHSAEEEKGPGATGATQSDYQSKPAQKPKVIE